MSGFDLERTDTICAPATATGTAAIAVVRVSGQGAEQVLARVFEKKRPGPHRPFVATLGYVLDASSGDKTSAVLDEALCVRFPDKKSYTGEPSFELSLHGGRSRVQSVLRSLVAAGCRLAEPGELTLRAVLTGKLDLTEAEAVEDLVKARTDEAARAALLQLKGALGDRLTPLRETLVDVLAELEARLDFPDEDLGDTETAALTRRLDDALQSAGRLLRSATLGRRLTEGARVVLFGLPNAGKSTLLNALLGEERALVHDTPGTTRDVLEAELSFGGVPAILVDVAGVREGTDIHPVEALGIARAKRELERADVQLLVVDASQPSAEEDAAALAKGARDDALLLFTKTDLLERPRAQPHDALLVSAKSGAGLAALREKLQEQLIGGDDSALDEVLLTRERQRTEVEALHDGLAEASRALRSGEPHEVVASELRRAGAALDRLFGRSLTEDVLEVIFSRFCIGK